MAKEETKQQQKEEQEPQQGESEKELTAEEKEKLDNEKYEKSAQCFEVDCTAVRQFRIDRKTGDLLAQKDEDIKLLVRRCSFCKFFRPFDLLRQREGLRLPREV